MKHYLTFLALFGFFIQFSFAQHIPPTHYHTNSICYGYATGRAFGLTQWSGGDCPLETLNRNNIPSEFFDSYSYSHPSSLYALNAGDILVFSGHAAYLVSVPPSDLREYTSLYDCADVSGAGQNERSITLDSLILERGVPVSFKRRKKDLWELRAQNDFSGGKIGYQGSEYNSPFDKYGLDWKSSISVTAVDDGRTYTFKKVFQRWEDSQGALVSSNPTALLKVGENHHILKTYTAIFLNEYNVPLENQFIGLPNSGIMKVNAATETLPGSFPVLQGDSLNLEALNQIINGINYKFVRWSDGTTSRYKTIFPEDERTWVAEFEGKPVRVQNLHDDGAVMAPIHLVWDEHPNTNCQYKIWRKVKPDPPELIATKSHGTTSYTDYDYVKTSGYIADLLSYDVRAYYTIEGTSADPNWYSIYGANLYSKNSSTDSIGTLNNPGPAMFTLSSYPNPFNSSTTIAFQLPHETFVRVSIYDLRGCLVKTLLEERRPAGAYTVQWNGLTEAGHSAASGIYILRLESPDYNIARKVLLAR